MGVEIRMQIVVALSGKKEQGLMVAAARLLLQPVRRQKTPPVTDSQSTLSFAKSANRLGRYFAV